MLPSLIFRFAGQFSFLDYSATYNIYSIMFDHECIVFVKHNAYTIYLTSSVLNPCSVFVKYLYNSIRHLTTDDGKCDEQIKGRIEIASVTQSIYWLIHKAVHNSRCCHSLVSVMVNISVLDYFKCSHLAASQCSATSN